MKLFVLILSRTDLLEELLDQWSRLGVTGATILNSTGMAATLSQSQKGSSSFFQSLTAALSLRDVESKTIFSLLSEEDVAKAMEGVELVLGDLSLPETGVAFTLPVDFLAGLPKYRPGD